MLAAERAASRLELQAMQEHLTLELERREAEDLRALIEGGRFLLSIAAKSKVRAVCSDLQECRSQIANHAIHRSATFGSM